MGRLIEIDADEVEDLLNNSKIELTNNILSIVRENYIPKADYEKRLKADLVAILTELQLEIEELVKEEELIDKKWANGLHYSEKIIQHKIDKLKEAKDGENND